MLISVEYNFALFRTPKTASTALFSAIEPHARIKIAGPGFKHISPKTYQQFIAPCLTGLKPGFEPELVAVMRHPVEWLFSWYRYRSRKALGNPKHPNHDNYAGNISFDQFIEAARKQQNPAQGIFKQYRFLSIDKKVAVHHLFRYDRLDLLCRWFSERIGKEISLSQLNPSPKAELKLTEASKQRLQKFCARDYRLYNMLADGHHSFPEPVEV